MSRYSMRKYPYAGDTITSGKTKHCRFMGADLDDFLNRISEKAMADCPIGIYGDMRKLHEAAKSDDPDDRRIIWHVNNYGTHIVREREAFIQDTLAYNYMTKERIYSPDMLGYIIEVNGYEDNVLWGNVFEAGNHDDYTWHIRKTALPLDSVTLTYSSGMTIDVGHYEYARDYNHYMHKRGTVTGIEYHPVASMTGLTGLLYNEREDRMALPIGNIEEHMAKLGEGLSAYAPIIKLRPPKPSIADRLAVADREAKLYNERSNTKTTNIKEII